MRPRSPYGVAKLAAFGLVDTLREKHGLHASSAIAYNHESPRRPERFLPRKVVARRCRDQARPAGRARARRPGRGPRLVATPATSCAATGSCSQQDEPGDYVLASGVGRTVGDLVAAAFAVVGLDPGPYVRVDERFVRPSERTPPVGDIALARERLGWEPETSFAAMIEEMVHADLAALEGTTA